MTNSENKTVAVAVPVELLTRILSNRFHPEEVEALIPKPVPRLVAVSFEQWGEIDDIRELPDLVTLIDEAVRPVLDSARLSLVMGRIRDALGVGD